MTGRSLDSQFDALRLVRASLKRRKAAIDAPLSNSDCNE